VSSISFALLRPWLLARNLTAQRDRADLQNLRAERDPEGFVWTILPHAARTFSMCIAMLPARAAKAAAVGYLYCRVLDTYEDLHPDPVSRIQVLRAFAARFDGEVPTPAPSIPEADGRDARDLGHLLLVERCELVDHVYLSLSSPQRAIIRDLVAAMAEGMCWSSECFRRQGFVLLDSRQLTRYCRNVLGLPVVFAMRLLAGGEPSPELVEDAMLVGEMIQLANITRDIEKDLTRGVAYHPRLKAFLRRPADEATAEIREVREELLRRALHRVPAYGRLLHGMRLPRFSLGRASAVLMLLFTDRYFRTCARRVGLPAWKGPRSLLGLMLEAWPTAVSRRWTKRIVDRVERSFLSAAVRPAIGDEQLREAARPEGDCISD